MFAQGRCKDLKLALGYLHLLNGGTYDFEEPECCREIRNGNERQTVFDNIHVRMESLKRWLRMGVLVLILEKLL